MRRAVLIAIPFMLAVPIAYAWAFMRLGHEPMLGPALAGAAGWLVALVLRTPIGLVGMQVTGSEERTQTWVTASSGPLEEAVRLGALIIVGRDLQTALWVGLGWASIEVLYTIANGLALAALSGRTDPEAERIRGLLPPSALTGPAAAWGVVERAWASAVHVGFTLIVAASPILVFVTAPLHSAINVAFLRGMRRLHMALVSVSGLAVGAAVLAVGLAMHGGLP